MQQCFHLPNTYIELLASVVVDHNWCGYIIWVLEMEYGNIMVHTWSGVRRKWYGKFSQFLISSTTFSVYWFTECQQSGDNGYHGNFWSIKRNIRHSEDRYHCNRLSKLSSCYYKGHHPSRNQSRVRDRSCVPAILTLLHGHSLHPHTMWGLPLR